jgi:hypothetical protein
MRREGRAVSDQREDFADPDLPPAIRWTEAIAPVLAALGLFAVVAGIFAAFILWSILHGE